MPSAVARGFDLNQLVAVAEGRQLDLVDDEGLALFNQDGGEGFHAGSRSKPPVVAGVANFGEEAYPIADFEIGFGGENPVEQALAFLFGAPRVDGDKFVGSAHAFDLGERLFAERILKIMNAVNRDDQVEGRVVVGELFRRADVDQGASLAVGVLLSVGGNIEAAHGRAGEDLEEIVKEKALAGTNIEDACIGGELVVLDEALRDGEPAAVVEVAAVAVATFSVEEVAAELFREGAVGGGLGGGAGFGVALRLRETVEEIDLVAGGEGGGRHGGLLRTGR